MQRLQVTLKTDTVAVEEYLDDNGWVSAEQSDIQIEQGMNRADVDAGRRLN